MEEYFPFITKAYGTLQYTSWAILYLIVMWQIFRAFGGPITEAENPWHLVIRGAIYGLLIGYAKNIAMFCLEIARIPYTSLLDISMTGEDFTFAGVEEVLTNGLTTIVAASTVAGLILVLILLIALGWNYFKLLLETVERYIVVGVLCYTSPLAFSMGGSKTTNNVFKSWCRMVGSQLILLVMNVWFLRGFASSMGHFIGNGGALTTGKGSIFLWMFCALAYLRCAQRFDSYLSSLGLNVAQTGSSMAMEMMMAARVVSGMGGGAKSAGSVFGGKTGSTATGTGAAASGFAAGFASKFSPNSYVRDAVVEGGSNIGFGGGAGFMGRAFGGMAARNGATLNGDSISSVASRAPGVSGSIGGEIADRSLSNYMPHMQGFQMKGTQISGGHISTTATTPDGKTASVDMYSASQFEKPEVPHSVVTASDGSQWYQMASGEGRGAFYDAPVFGGMPTEAPSQEVASGIDDQAVAASIGAEVEAIQQGMGSYPRTGLQDSSAEEVVLPGGDAPAFGTQFVQGADGELPGGMPLQSSTEEMQPGMPGMAQDVISAETVTGSPGDTQPFGAGFVGGTEIPGQAVAEGNDEVPITMPAFNQDNVPFTGSEHLQQDVPFGAGFVGGVEQIPATGMETPSGEDTPLGMPVFNGEPSSIPGESLQNETGISEMPAFVPTFVGSSESVQPGGYENKDQTDIPMSGIPGSEHHQDAPQFAAGHSAPQDSSFYQTDFAGAGIPAGPGHSYQDNHQTGESSASAYAEAPLVAATFPNAQEGTMLRTVGEGVIEASTPDGGNTLWYNSAFYHEPDAPHDTMAAANGVQWYTMQQKAEAPQFESGVEAGQYNQAAFQNFMPGYDTPVSKVDGSGRQDGHFEVRHADGSGTAFYDTARYAAPRGDYKVFEDSRGNQWYAIRGEAAVDRKPVYENGQAVYENDKLKTVTIETVRYKQTPAKFSEPKKRGDIERKPPRRKK
ncbi:MAG: hypothetical protein IJ001_05295 [Oscillospiraceae bacterium]|nr:hypothetical protein [Oscillospiraceae bacterium]